MHWLNHSQYPQKNSARRADQCRKIRKSLVGFIGVVSGFVVLACLSSVASAESICTCVVRNPIMGNCIINHCETVSELSNSASPVTFNRPALSGYAVDWCKYYGKQCGRPAAINYCKIKGYSRASALLGGMASWMKAGFPVEP